MMEITLKIRKVCSAEDARKNIPREKQRNEEGKETRKVFLFPLICSYIGL